MMAAVVFGVAGAATAFGGQAIAEAKAAPPTAPVGEPKTVEARKQMLQKTRRKKLEGVTESLTS